MNFDAHLVDIECGLTRTSISPSNIANAGFGLFNLRNTAISVDTALAYWGKLFLWKITDGSVFHAEIDDRIKARLIKIPFQPFINKGFFVYIAASLSCIASYMNDANFISSETTIQNNCLFQQERFMGDTGIGLKTSELYEWCQSCIMYILTSRRVPSRAEFLVAYNI